jgi:hypothetical protein
MKYEPLIFKCYFADLKFGLWTNKDVQQVKLTYTPTLGCL